MYSKEEMLQIYRDGKFKESEFADKFQQVPNATTPEFLIPLALLPIEDEEKELRLNPVVTGNPAGAPGGRRLGPHALGGRDGQHLVDDLLDVAVVRDACVRRRHRA